MGRRTSPINKAPILGYHVINKAGGGAPAGPVVYDETAPAKMQSLGSMLSFEPEEEKLWWQGESVLDRAQPQVTLSWWERANQTVDNAIEKAAKYISDKWNKLLQAIKDYFSYDEEE